MNTSLFILLFLSSYLLTAQTAEKIYGKNRVLKTNEYYLEQIGLWKKEIDKNPENPQAWYNYYRANRNAYIVGEEKNTKDFKGKSRFDRMNSIVGEMGANVPGSFEYNYVKWLNGNNDETLFPYLEMAHKLSPSSSDPVMDLALYYEIKGNYKKRDQMLTLFDKLGEYSPGLLNYGYNLLSGLKQDAILFTEGDKDTEASLILQASRSIRKDVKLLNINLLLKEEYRKRVFNELEIPQLEFDPLVNDDSFFKFQRVIIEHCSKNKKGRPVFVAVNVSFPYRMPVSPKLYLTGLAYYYSLNPIENISMMEENIEQKYLLDYLKVYFPNDISEGNVNSINGNYLPSLVTLSKQFSRKGNKEKGEYYKSLAGLVAEKAGLIIEFQEYFNNTD